LRGQGFGASVLGRAGTPLSRHDKVGGAGDRRSRYPLRRAV